MNAIKVIAFDFWDVFAVLNHPMYVYMKEHGVDPGAYSKPLHDLIIAHDLGRMTEREFLEQASKVVGLELPYEACRLTFNEELLNRNLIAIVKRLKVRYKIILLSNNSREYSEIYLFQTGLDQLFDDLILSYEVGFRKPAKEMYQLLIQGASAKPEEILFVDDDPSKFPVAKELGIQTLRYVRGEADKQLEALVAG